MDFETIKAAILEVSKYVIPGIVAYILGRKRNEAESKKIEMETTKQVVDLYKSALTDMEVMWAKKFDDLKQEFSLMQTEYQECKQELFKMRDR